MLISGKMSVGIRRAEKTPNRHTSAVTAAMVYGRRNAKLENHIALFRWTGPDGMRAGRYSPRAPHFPFDCPPMDSPLPRTRLYAWIAAVKLGGYRPAGDDASAWAVISSMGGLMTGGGGAVSPPGMAISHPRPSALLSATQSTRTVSCEIAAWSSSA